MHKPETLRTRFREVLDHPVRVITKDGRTFDIRQVGMVLVSEYDVHIGSPSRKPGIYSHITRVPISDIAALEDLPLPVPPNNGQDQQP